MCLERGRRPLSYQLYSQKAKTNTKMLQRVVWERGELYYHNYSRSGNFVPPRRTRLLGLDRDDAFPTHSLIRRSE